MTASLRCELPPKESNPGFQVQSLASYRLDEVAVWRTKLPGSHRPALSGSRVLRG